MSQVRIVLVSIVAGVLAAVSTGQPPSAGASADVGASVVAWGADDYGQSTVPATAQSGVTQVAAGVRHSLALRNDGSVVAWGSNDEGQTTVPAGASSGVTQVAAGSFRSLALKAGGVIAWGLNAEVPAEAQSGVTQIAAGAFHTLALKSDGSVVAWGNNAYGQSTVPTEAQSGVIQVSAGGFHSLALKSDGSVVAWGDDAYGQSTVPVEAPSGVVQVAAGSDHSVALKGDGSVVAWGQNFYGQTTVPDAASSGVTQVAASGASDHTLALRSDGSVVAWGDDASGQSTVPPAAAGGVTYVAAGAFHSLAVVAPPATVTCDQASQSVAENAGPAQVTVTRGGNVANTASVHYARTSGTATPGADFTLDAGTLTFAPGQTSRTIPVTIVDDAVMEPDETIVITLSAPGPGVVLGAQTATTVTIRASDQQPDVLVGTRAAGPYVGNNVYNRTGAGQTRTVSAHRGQTRTFYVRIANDGNARNAFSVRGSAAVAGSTVRYFAGTVDITRPMRSTSGRSVSLAPTASTTVAVKIKIGAKAVFGSVKYATVRATWVGDVTRTDVVMARVKVVR